MWRHTGRRSGSRNLGGKQKSYLPPRPGHVIGPSMRSYKTSLSLGKGKSPLSRHDHSVSVCSSVHGTPDIRSLLFISQMPLMEKSSAFFSDKNSKKNITFQWTQSNHCSWNHYQNRATEVLLWNSEAWATNRANCKRKSSSFMRRLSKYKQKLDNWCIDHDVKHKVKGFYWIKK